jgi:arylsulfatase A-like enzyme
MFGPDAKRREYVFGARSRIDDTPDRIRTVRDAQYKYIRNFEPERPYLQPMAYAAVTNPAYNRMWQLFTAGKLSPDQTKFFATHRPTEELYDLRADPFELHNLAGNESARPALDRLRSVLTDWLKETHDESPRPEDPAEVRKELDLLDKSVKRMRQTLDLPPGQGLNRVLQEEP